MDVLAAPDNSSVVYPCPTPGLYRPPVCLYDPANDAGRVIVVDNGSHTIRAGWAGDPSPGVVFRSQICRPKPKSGIAGRAVVGDFGPGLSGWDFSRPTQRYCFESDVPINMEGQEALLDWALLRMGVTDCSSHPLLLTETSVAPSGVRAQLAQLVFEAYGLPALSFVGAAPAAFYYHQSAHQQQLALWQQQQQMWQQLGPGGIAEVNTGFCGSSSALVVCSGHSATYVVPVYKGQPQWNAAFRCWAGGAAGTAHLQQLLGVRYPTVAGGLLGNWQLVEGMKEAFCFSAQDYGGLLQKALAEPTTAGGLAVRVQLPYAPAATEAPTAAAAQDPAAKSQEMRARGKALVARRRQKQLEEKQTQLEAWQLVQAQAAADADSAPELLASVNMRSLEELDSQVEKLTAECSRLEAAMGQQSRASPAVTPAMTPAATPGPTPPHGPTAPAAAAAAAAANGAVAGADAMDVDTPVDAQQQQQQQRGGQEAAGQQAMETGAEGDNEPDTDTDTASEGGAIAAAAAAAAAALLQQQEQGGLEALPQQQQQQQQGGDDEGEHSSSTVTDEGLGQQEVADMQEVLQQVKKISRQGSKAQGLEAQGSGAVQQPPQQQPQLQPQVSAPQAAAPVVEEVSYLGIPDSELTADEIKIKRRQQLLESGRLARERAALRRAQLAELKEQQLQYEDKQFAETPFDYLTALQQRHMAAAARVEARKRRRLGGTGAQELEGLAAAGSEQRQQLTGAKGRRRDERHRERMRLIAQAASSKGSRGGRGGRGSRGGRVKQPGGRRGRGRGRGRAAAAAERKSHKAAISEESEEEGFGDEAADWQVYRDMDLRASDSDAEAEEAAELAWTTERLQQIGAAVAAAAAPLPAPPDTTVDAAVDEQGQQQPADAAATAAAAASEAAAAGVNPLEAAAAAVAGQLMRIVYQAASSAAAAAGPAQAAAPVSALYPTVTPRQDLGFTPTTLGGAFEGIDLNLLGISHLAGFRRQGPQHPLTAEDYQLVLGVERIRVPELLYQPAALAGVDQAGLSEVLGLVFRRLPKHVAEAVTAGGVVLTGGNACFAGFGERLAAELASLRPPDKPMPIYTSPEPLLDTWRGAAALAAGSSRWGAARQYPCSSAGGAGGSAALFGDPFAPGAGALSRHQYEEAGVDYLKEYKGFKYPDL